MRYISKGSANAALLRQPPPQTSARAKERWNGFQQRHKKATRRKCLTEQYHLCGYSESELKDLDWGMHLDHIEPKSRNPQRTFDHNNLIVCAIDDAKVRRLSKEEVFGGHAKGSWYSDDFIHPLMKDCRDYFFFEIASGKVIPNMKLSRRERARARLTICKLNLNSPVLRQRRKTWLKSLESEIVNLRNNNKALQNFCNAQLLPRNGRLSSFHSARRQLFGPMGEHICQQHNPPL